MSKNIQHIIHLNSSSWDSNNDESLRPSSGAVAYGELVVNYNSSGETIYLRNSDDEIVGFVNEKRFGKANKVISASLNDLNTRLLDTYTKTETDGAVATAKNAVLASLNVHTANTSIHMTAEEKATISSAVDAIEDLSGNVYTKAEVDAKEQALSGSIDSLSEAIDNDELVIASALNDLNTRVDELTADVDSSYSKDEVDAIVNPLSSNVTELTANLAELSGNACTKQELIDDELVISSSLNDLNTRMSDAETAINNTYSKSEVDALISGSGGGGGEGGTVTVDTALSPTSQNPVANSAITTVLTAHTGNTTMHVTAANKTAWDNKVSGVTVNNGTKITPTNGVVNIAETDPTVPAWAKAASKPTYTATEVGALPTGATLDSIQDGETRKLSNYAEVSTVDTLNGVVTAHTADTTIHVTSANKTAWDNKVSGVTVNGSAKQVNNGVVDLGTVITAETQLSTATTGTGNAITDISVNGHEITATKGSTFLTSHQMLKTINGSGLTGSGNISIKENVQADWNADSGDSAILNKPRIPSAPGTLSTTATTTLQTHTSENLSGSIALHKVSKTGSYSDLVDKPTIPTVNDSTITLTFNGSTVGTFTLNQASAKTIDIGALIGVPSYTSADNGKILGVVNGQLAWITPTTIYTGSGTPSSAQGNDGDIYLQTS